MEDAFTRWSTQSLTPARQWTRSEKPKIRFCALPGGSPIFREWHRSTMADSPPIRWKMLSHDGWLFCHWATAHPNPGVTFISEDIFLMTRMMTTMVLVTFTQTQGWLSYLMGDRGSIRWPILRFNGWRSHANFDPSQSQSCCEQLRIYTYRKGYYKIHMECVFGNLWIFVFVSLCIWIFVHYIWSQPISANPHTTAHRQMEGELKEQSGEMSIKSSQLQPTPSL